MVWASAALVGQQRLLRQAARVRAARPRTSSVGRAPATAPGRPGAARLGCELVEAAKADGLLRRPITDAERCRSRGRSGTATCAICGCTLSMSIRKLSAPRLSARRSKVPALGGALRVDLGRRPARRRRRSCAARRARPGPCPAPTARRASPGAGRAPGSARSRCAGLRKNWSICFSASDSEARSSCTTLPMVWRSETRRYSSSIHGSSGCGVARLGAPRDALRPGAARARRSRVVEVAVLERGIQVQQAGGDFHRQRGPAALRCRGRLRGRRLQRVGQQLADGIQPLQRIADQRELLGQAGQAVRLAAGHRRPDVLGGGDALARLRDPAPGRSGRGAAVCVVDRPRGAAGRRPGAPRRAAAPVRAVAGRAPARRRTAGPAPGARRPRPGRAVLRRNCASRREAMRLL